MLKGWDVAFWTKNINSVLLESKGFTLLIIRTTRSAFNVRGFVFAFAMVRHVALLEEMLK